MNQGSLEIILYCNALLHSDLFSRKGGVTASVYGGATCVDVVSCTLPLLRSCEPLVKKVCKYYMQVFSFLGRLLWFWPYYCYSYRCVPDF